jgi:prefoldin alpha subunit
MSEEKLRQELQRLSTSLQQFEQYSKQLQSQLDAINQYLADLRRSKTTLVNLKEEKDPEETLLNVGAGIMLKAKPLEPDKVFYSAGAGVVVTKSIDEALEGLDGRIEEVETEGQNLQQQLSIILNQMGNMERQAANIYQQLQGPTKAQYDPNLVS